MSRGPLLTIRQILAWADAFHGRHGRWPTCRLGRIIGSLGEKWYNIDNALRQGLRGLPGGSSLTRLLEERRGARNHRNLPRLTIRQILAWADRHHRLTGAWPTARSGTIHDAPSETWAGVEAALEQVGRGLPPGHTLPQLLAEHRGVRNIQALGRLTIRQILAWADAFHRQTGRWPAKDSGPVAGAMGETWSAVDTALQQGHRGLPGGDTLRGMLARFRNVRNRRRLPPLTERRILAWARAHRNRTGHWPSRASGPIPATADESWLTVDKALQRGRRGLHGHRSLGQILAPLRQRGR
jgi:hypothetical protein